MAVRVAIVGAGPAGLYLAYLLKRSKLKVEVEVFEQNPADATFGFGLVFSERALEFLNDEDPDTLAAIRPALEHWNDSILVHKGREVRIDGMGYTGIGRLRLLQILQARACSVGVEPKYLHTIDNLETCGDADLIVGADGVNSVVRRGYEDVFGTTVTYLTNRFAWFGTAKKFEALTHTFVETGLGHFNAHHHPHAPDMSTFVVEVDEPTFFRAGFDEMDADQAKAVCEQVFAETLDGHRLVSNKSIWRQFPKVWNERWSIGNRVLVGDALHTAHFSIGSGTRLAMEDAIALAKALEQHASDFPAALAAYEEARKLVVTRLVTAANSSAAWYERFAEHMALTPMDFAMSYITRSGRVDLERLRRSSPAFVAAYEKSRTGKNTRETDVIYLVRHGETTWNRVGRQQGHNDSPLTELGIEQARAAGRLLQRAIPGIHNICIETSPLGRARQTALIISEVLGLDPSMILVTPLLIEHHLGCWQGLTHAEIDARYPGAWQTREQNKWDYVVPDGESYALVAERAKQWLAKQRHAPITIAVTHAIISRTIQGAYGGFTPSQTVARSHPQDRIYRLHAGRVEEMSCEE